MARIRDSFDSRWLEVTMPSQVDMREHDLVVAWLGYKPRALRVLGNAAYLIMEEAGI